MAPAFSTPIQPGPVCKVRYHLAQLPRRRCAPQILELDLGSLTAGCMMPGEFEERLKQVQGAGRGGCAVQGDGLATGAACKAVSRRWF